MLWHQRMGHIIEKGLRALKDKGMIDCTIDFDLCEHCIYGKQNQVRFASGATRAKGILELMPSDVSWTYSYSIIRKICVLRLIYR